MSISENENKPDQKNMQGNKENQKWLVREKQIQKYEGTSEREKKLKQSKTKMSLNRQLEL